MVKQSAGKSQKSGYNAQSWECEVFMGTRGRYLPHNMLLAFVEELGHDYDELLEGRPSSS
jgi:hypothetical protein